MIQWDDVARGLKFQNARDMFDQMYNKDSQSLETLARRFSVANHTMRAALLKAGIPIRSRGGVQTQRLHITDEILKEIREVGVLTYAAQNEFNPATVYKALKRAGYDSRCKPLAQTPPTTQTGTVQPEGDSDHEPNQ